jgi:hypothetical protein
MIAKKGKRPIWYSLAVIAWSAVVTAAAAEEQDEFSRANCFNNESITYDFFAPPFQVQVISWHYDGDNGGLVHHVGASDPIWCYGSFGACPSTCFPWMACGCGIIASTRMAAIHNW